MTPHEPKGLPPAYDPPVTVVELTPDLWPALEALFGPTGACGGCWCMWWRVPRGGALWDAAKGAPNKATFRRLVRAGEARGVLAMDGDRAIGWCAFGPRKTFPRTDRVKALRRDTVGVWSINCFFIARDARGQGVARALLDGAIAACRRHGATIVEGYPVTTTRDGRRVAPTFAWTGPRTIFDDAGFTVVQAVVPERPLVQLRLSRPSRSESRRRSSASRPAPAPASTSRRRTAATATRPRARRAGRRATS